MSPTWCAANRAAQSEGAEERYRLKQGARNGAAYRNAIHLLLLELHAPIRADLEAKAPRRRQHAVVHLLANDDPQLFEPAVLGDADENADDLAVTEYDLAILHC